MSTAVPASSSVQYRLLLAAGIGAGGLFVYLLGLGARQAMLFLIGIGLGIALYHAAFGFAGAYRRALLEKDISGVSAQLVMLAAAMLLFAPILAQGGVFGRTVSGALAPVSLSMALGAFIFGIGMQVGGACASGSLFTAGGGNLRILLVLVFFCIGTFWGSLDLHWWRRLPGIGPVSLGREFGWVGAMSLQLGALALIYLGLRLLGGRNKRSLWWEDGFRWQHLLKGPWPLLLGAAMLALLNWATLLVAGHAWSITWGLSLWAAKVAALMGWDPTTSAFWSSGFPRGALARPLLDDTVSVMNLGILLGALTAASLAGKVAPTFRMSLPALASAVLGGLLLGYGARLAYGCNIGAFFSGVASTSLHGWVWIVCAIAGNAIGVRLRPLFHAGG